MTIIISCNSSSSHGCAALLWNTDVSITELRESCVAVFFLSVGNFILDQWRSKCGCRGGGTWPITLGTKEEIFLTLPGGRLRNQAWISDTVEKQNEGVEGGAKKTQVAGGWADSTLRCTHMLSGSCTLAWASSSEVMDATLGGTSTPAEEGEGPGWDASWRHTETCTHMDSVVHIWNKISLAICGHPGLYYSKNTFNPDVNTGNKCN